MVEADVLSRDEPGNFKQDQYKKDEMMKSLVRYLSIAVVLAAGVVSAGTYSGGEGTPEMPYQISSAADWQELTTTPEDWGEYFILTQDIDLAGITVVPVGNGGDGFYGIFDGNGHTISNAVINLPDDDYVGLFGRVSSYGTISRLGVKDITVTGYYYVGGLAGYAYDGIISGCYATGTVHGDCLVGGLVGYSNFGSILACYARVDVAGDSTIGGLVGSDYNSSIADCFAVGLASGNSEVGGLMGWSWKESHTTTACFWDIEISGTTDGVGGMDPDPAGVMGRTTAEMMAEAMFTDAGWDFEANDGDAADWQMRADDYPHLSWEVFMAINGQGTETDPYQISSVNDFLEFADKANAAKYWAVGVYIRLESDLNLQGIDFEPIGGSYDDGQGNYEDLYFEGNFDGNGHRIFNATLGQAGQGYIGLFGLVGIQGVISKLGVENVTAIGEYHVGGLVGSNSGTIRFCYTTGQITGFSNAGGLAGYSYNGTITSCYSRCSVSGTYSTGGLVGHNVENSISDSYSTGLVSGSYFKGGLLGYNLDGTVSSCFWDMDTSNQPTSAGGEGRTTAQMKTLATFTIAGWDFDATWFIPNTNYPRLWWEPRYSAGQGTSDDPYQISSPGDWQELTTIPGDWDKHFIVTADLDFSGMVLTPVAPDTLASTDYQFEGTPFTGVVDGQGHTLRHIVMSQPDEDFVGLFGAIGAGGRVENLRLEAISVHGRLSVGALAGLNQGTIAGCRSDGVVQSDYYHCGGLVGDNNGGVISMSQVKGTVLGNFWVGGLAGYHHNGGTIQSCYAGAEVRGTSYLGGLAGFAEDWGTTVVDCYATGDVTGSTTSAGGLVGYLRFGFVWQCYSTGDVACPANAGGVLGYNISGSGFLSDLFWDIQTCHASAGVGGGDAGGVAGKTTAQMKSASTYPWNFTEIWAICDGMNYPRLQWQRLAGDFACPDGVAVEDLQHLAGQWLAMDCGLLNDCGGADMDISGQVDMADFVLFAGQWMEGI